MRKWIPGRSTFRQGGSYVAVGLLQLLLDWMVFVLLSAIGMAVEPANVVGRIAGATLGFWLNGRITFAGEDTAVGRRQFMRFLAMWLGTTVCSTWAVGHVDETVGLGWAWLAKPCIDATLAAAGFLLSKHWVYRR